MADLELTQAKLIAQIAGNLVTAVVSTNDTLLNHLVDVQHSRILVNADIVAAKIVDLAFKEYISPERAQQIADDVLNG